MTVIILADEENIWLLHETCTFNNKTRHVLTLTRQTPSKVKSLMDNCQGHTQKTDMTAYTCNK